AHADAGGRVCGVSKYDAASGEIVGVARGNSRVTHVTAGGALAAFDEVQVGANGTAVKLDAGVAVGYATTAATNGGDAEISLY
ncbi:capsid cement protein, partial [Mycolicibacterium goodii]|uniref:capsid cement protein n=1 Tax=Mycolicibacterium goodii TaxID=134601 RepID=UPI001BDBB5EC